MEQILAPASHRAKQKAHLCNGVIRNGIVSIPFKKTQLQIIGLDGVNNWCSKKFLHRILFTKCSRRMLFEFLAFGFFWASNREWREVVSPSLAFSATANLNRSSELMSW
jgi:hypothetical protein